MKAIKVMLLVLIVLAAAVAIIGLLLPGEYTVKRSVVVDTNPTHVAAYVRNLNQWKHWSPWENSPGMTIEPGEQTSGVGATQSWSSDKENGRLEVIAVTPDRIDFVCYFQNEQYISDCSITFEQLADSTTVTWTMTGIMDKPPVLGPYMALMMKQQLGPLFTQGLDNLKAVAEQGPATLSDAATTAEQAPAEEQTAEMKQAANGEQE